MYWNYIRLIKPTSAPSPRHLGRGLPRKLLREPWEKNGNFEQKYFLNVPRRFIFCKKSSTSMRILLRKSGLDLQPSRLAAIFSLLRFSEKVILISEVIKSVTAIFTHHALSEHHQPHKMVKHTQAIRRLFSTNCLSVFDHFVRLALNWLRLCCWWWWCWCLLLLKNTSSRMFSCPHKSMFLAERAQRNGVFFCLFYEIPFIKKKSSRGVL